MHCRLALCLIFIVAVGAIRFHEVTDGKTHFHGVPVEKYVSSMNRIIEIEDLLSGETETQRRFGEVDWIIERNDPKVNPFLFQGDIVLNEEQLEALVESYEVQLAKQEGRDFSRLFSIGNSTLLWTTFPIPWTIDPKNPSFGGYDVIRRGIHLWEDLTCVTFVENGTTDATKRGIEFFDGGGCYSELGRRSVNKLSITDGCEDTITVAHEIGHTLGLFHEQMRFDADQYLDFFMLNVNPNKTRNFDPPEPFYEGTYRGIPYDYGSAMQYDRFSFSDSFDHPSMLPKDRNYNYTMGQDFELSFTDAMEINMMYCGHACSKKLPCQNGGYTDPKDCSKCRCPDGLAGTLCERLQESDAVCGTPTRRATSTFQTLSELGHNNCYYKIEAPAGRKLKIILDSVRFQGEDPYYDSCTGGFLEIKYANQYESAGARFCSEKFIGTRTMTSLRNEALVIYKSSNRKFHFSLRYKYE